MQIDNLLEASRVDLGIDFELQNEDNVKRKARNQNLDICAKTNETGSSKGEY